MTMGSNLSRRVNRFITRNERRLLLVGLDGAGKTTILHQMRLGEAVKTVPTLEFNVETINFEKLTLNIWDVGGQDTLRPYWRHNFTGTQGIIFVVDSSDTSRLNLAKAELEGVLKDSQLKYASVLILLNKQDLEDALSPEELESQLDLKRVCHGLKAHIQPSVATTGNGIQDGLHWLCENMEEL